MGQQARPRCPFCVANGMVKLIAQNDDAYLIAVLRPGTTEVIEHAYFVIPKEHIESLRDLPQFWMQTLMDLIDQVPESHENYNISINVGRRAGQRVQHVHFWVLTRDHEDETMASFELGMAAIIELLNQMAAAHTLCGSHA
ncbi:MAG TPA: HIT domain-containing protein [Candidatus Saccharimonadales bacterium]|nr:HIT domain-containing protein [Candidatus Saccharimonadales bacterium]